MWPYLGAADVQESYSNHYMLKRVQMGSECTAEGNASGHPCQLQLQQAGHIGMALLGGRKLL